MHVWRGCNYDTLQGQPRQTYLPRFTRFKIDYFHFTDGLTFLFRFKQIVTDAVY